MAWVPMSPVVQDGPDRAGSVRHSACFCPAASTGVASQSCAYSAITMPDAAELARRHHGPRLPDHGIAGIVVRQHEGPAGLLDQGRQALRIAHGRGHRLVADDVEARLQERPCDRPVAVVRRHDGDGVDPVGPAPLALHHGLGSCHRCARVRSPAPGPRPATARPCWRSSPPPARSARPCGRPAGGRRRSGPPARRPPCRAAGGGTACAARRPERRPPPPTGRARAPAGWRPRRRHRRRSPRSSAR